MASLSRTLPGTSLDGLDGCNTPRLPELRGEDESAQGGAEPLGVEDDRVISHLRLQVHNLTHQLQLLDHLETGDGGAAQDDDDCICGDDECIYGGEDCF